jgi:hypothetical protein
MDSRPFDWFRLGDCPSVLLQDVLKRFVCKLLKRQSPLTRKLIEGDPILGSESYYLARHQLLNSRSIFFRLVPTFFTARLTAFLELPVFFAS